MGGIQRLKRTVKAFSGIKARAGWFSSAKYTNEGVPVARVAMWQEFGTRKITPRPFVRPTILEKSGEWLDITRKGINSVFNGRNTAMGVMTVLAQRVGKGVVLLLRQLQVRNVVKEHLLEIVRSEVFQLGSGAVQQHAPQPADFGIYFDGGLHGGTSILLVHTCYSAQRPQEYARFPACAARIFFVFLCKKALDIRHQI